MPSILCLQLKRPLQGKKGESNFLTVVNCSQMCTIDLSRIFFKNQVFPKHHVYISDAGGLLNTSSNNTNHFILVTIYSCAVKPMHIEHIGESRNVQLMC